MHREQFANQYGPWAVVIGASEGIGRAFAFELAARGLSLVLVARRPGPLATLSHELERFAVPLRTVILDVGRPDVVETLLAATADLEIGLLVYNAALSKIGPFLDVSPEEHMRVIDINVRGPLLLSHTLGTRMRERGRGGIILMSSMSGLQGTGLVASYAASKAFDMVLAEGLWQELRQSGIHVLTCIAGATRTPSFERTSPADGGALARPMEAEQVAREALLCLGRTSTMVPGRINRLASRIMRLLPRAQASSFISTATRRMYGSE